MDHLHPEDSNIPSYAQSSNRLDYAIVSNSLLQDISTTGLNHYHEFYPSDHLPIYLGIEPTFFGALPALVAQQFQYINSNSKLVGEFVTIIYQHLLDTGIFQRMSVMTPALPESTPSQIRSMGSSIDEQVTRAILSAEHRCKRPPREHWSKALHFASLHVKYW
jgi:hypothetical protein